MSTMRRRTILLQGESLKSIERCYLRLCVIDGRTVKSSTDIVCARRLRRFSAVRSSFVRKELTVTGNEVIETVDQSAVVDMTIFWVVHRCWRVHRRGEYLSTKSGGVWVIEKVTVLEENVTSNWHLSLRPMFDQS
jgi:hypothetical protein